MIRLFFHNFNLNYLKFAKILYRCFAFKFYLKIRGFAIGSPRFGTQAQIFGSGGPGPGPGRPKARTLGP